MEKKIVLNCITESVTHKAYVIEIDFGTGRPRDTGLILDQEEGKTKISYRKTGEEVEMRKAFYDIESEEGREELLDDLNRYGLAGKHYCINHAVSDADPFNYGNEELERNMRWCYEDYIDLGYFFNADDVLEEVERLQEEADNEAIGYLKAYGFEESDFEGGPCYANHVWCDDDDEEVDF